jgi:hypothetical protein
MTYICMYDQLTRYSVPSTFHKFCITDDDDFFNQAEGSSAESITALARIDTVKQRMEAAYATLQVSCMWTMVHVTEVNASLTVVGYLLIDLTACWSECQDAAGLAQLSQSVEDVFSSGDLPKAAETLATMRHCLSAVGEVAEFANVRKQLEVLEERLDDMVQPRLVDALSNRKVFLTNLIYIC